MRRLRIAAACVLMACGSVPEPAADHAPREPASAARPIAHLVPPLHPIRAVGRDGWVAGGARVARDEAGQLVVGQPAFARAIVGVAHVEAGWLFLLAGGAVFRGAELTGPLERLGGVGELVEVWDATPFPQRGRLVFRTSRGRWTSTGEAPEPLRTTPFTNSVIFAGRDVGFAFLDGGLVERTRDGGVSWEPLDLPLGVQSGFARAIAPDAVCMMSTEDGWVDFLADGEVRVQTGDPPEPAQPAAALPDELYDALWRTFPVGLPPDRTSGRLAFDPRGVLRDARDGRPVRSVEGRWEHVTPWGADRFIAADQPIAFEGNGPGRWFVLGDHDPVPLEVPEGTDVFPDGAGRLLSWADECGAVLYDDDGPERRFEPPEGRCVTRVIPLHGGALVALTRRLDDADDPHPLLVGERPEVVGAPFRLDTARGAWSPLCTEPETAHGFQIRRIAGGGFLLFRRSEALDTVEFGVGGSSGCVPLRRLPEGAVEVGFRSRRQGIAVGRTADLLFSTEDGGDHWEPLDVRVEGDPAALYTDVGRGVGCGAIGCSVGELAVRWGGRPSPRLLGPPAEPRREGSPRERAMTFACTLGPPLAPSALGAPIEAGGMRAYGLERGGALALSWQGAGRASRATLPLPCTEIVAAYHVLAASSRGAMVECQPGERVGEATLPAGCACPSRWLWAPAGRRAQPLDWTEPGVVGMAHEDGTLLIERWGDYQQRVVWWDGAERASRAFRFFNTMHGLAFGDAGPELVRPGRDALLRHPLADRTTVPRRDAARWDLRSGLCSGPAPSGARTVVSSDGLIPPWILEWGDDAGERTYAGRLRSVEQVTETGACVAEAHLTELVDGAWASLRPDGERVLDGELVQNGQVRHLRCQLPDRAEDR